MARNILSTLNISGDINKFSMVKIYEETCLDSTYLSYIQEKYLAFKMIRPMSNNFNEKSVLTLLQEINAVNLSNMLISWHVKFIPGLILIY